MKHPVVASLFDESGNMGRPWAERGAIVHCFDILNDERMERVGEGLMVFHNWDLSLHVVQVAIQSMGPDIIFAFPPCTDLAVSGAAHFEAKRKANPNFQKEAVALARVVEKIDRKSVV